MTVYPATLNNIAMLHAPTNAAMYRASTASGTICEVHMGGMRRMRRLPIASDVVSTRIAGKEVMSRCKKTSSQEANVCEDIVGATVSDEGTNRDARELSILTFLDKELVVVS